MAPSNHETLLTNTEAVIAFASSIDSRPIAVATVASLLQGAKQNLKDGNFEVSLQKLDQLKDARLGIVWSESGDLGQGTRALVRDARNVTSDPTLLREDASEKYVMQVLNEVRAGITLLDTMEIDVVSKQEAKKQLLYVAEHAVDHIDHPELPKFDSANVIEFNTAIVNALETAGVRDAAVELNIAKEIVNFKDEHRHIVTLTSASDPQGVKHTVMEADIMLNGLTASQQKQYQRIAESTPPERLEGEEMSWYNTMSPHRQKMLQACALDIANGNKVIPTQLLGSIVGLRNAYSKVTAVQSQAQDQAQILAQSMHCGAPATKIKVENQDGIVQENIKQLQSFVPPGSRVHLNNLTSETVVNLRGENFIFDQLKKVANAVISFGASPMNKWRALGAGRDQKEFDKMLQNIGTDLQNVSNASLNTNSIGDFLQNENSKKNALREIEQLKRTNPKLASILEVAISAKELINQSSFFARSENVNLEISAKMQLISNSLSLKDGELRQIASDRTKVEQPTIVDFCKSGKDRTGLVETKNTQFAVAHHLGVDPNSELGRRNMFSQVAGGHTQEMAGVQGGTIGCHSIKTNPEFSLPDSDKSIDGIINQNSSRFNSKIKVATDKQQATIVEKFKTLYQRYIGIDETSSKPALRVKSRQEWPDALTAEVHKIRSGLAEAKTQIHVKSAISQVKVTGSVER